MNNGFTAPRTPVSGPKNVLYILRAPVGQVANLQPLAKRPHTNPYRTYTPSPNWLNDLHACIRYD